MTYRLIEIFFTFPGHFVKHTGLEMSKWYPTQLNRRAAHSAGGDQNTLWDQWCNLATGDKEGGAAEKAHV